MLNLNALVVWKKFSRNKWCKYSINNTPSSQLVIINYKSRINEKFVWSDYNKNIKRIHDISIQ